MLYGIVFQLDFLVPKTPRRLEKLFFVDSSSVLFQKSLIDMYSEVLDELTGYDSSYNIADNLPRYKLDSSVNSNSFTSFYVFV
jgi:hypothetical protein